MEVGWDAVSDVEWGRLFHAYGTAHETPGHLRALMGDSDKALREAVEHLNSAVIHQGTAWSVTPPAALVVAGLLHDPALSRATESSGPPLRATLLGFLAMVAESGMPYMTDDELRELAYPPGQEAAIAAVLEGILADDEEAWEDELVDAIAYQAVVGVRRVAPALLEAISTCLADDDMQVRRQAADAVRAFAALPGLLP